MLQIVKLYARGFDLDHLDVFWELADFDGASVNIRNFDFYVLRSESSAGPWDTLAGPFQDQYYFRDSSPLLMHKWRTLFYKIRVVDKTTNETMDFGPAAQAAEPDLMALEMIRQEDVLFREWIGRLCWLFPVRSFGPRCVCFDRVTNRRTKSNCLTCYDTSFLGGYLSPISFYGQIDPHAKSPSPTPYGQQLNVNSSGRLIAFPTVKPNDIIVETENKRWRVVTVTRTERLRTTVHQELALHEITPGDVEYKLPINIADLRALVPASERNFTNPQHVDHNNDDITDMLAVYGRAPRGTVR